MEGINSLASNRGNTQAIGPMIEVDLIMEEKDAIVVRWSSIDGFG